jgi:sulfite exporter TauE/SafE
VIELPLIFVAGMAASWHCVGMCGGFACALGADPRGRVATLLRRLSYNLGRVTTYCFLGALGGYLAADLCVSEPGAPPTAWAQRALAVASGLLMVGIGLRLLGWLRSRGGAPLHGFGVELIAPGLRGLLRLPGPTAPLAFGVLNGFLPCPLVYAFAAQAAGSGGALPGVLVMLAFGLGTFPALLLVAGLGDRLGGAWRRRGVDVAGALIMILGLITLARGLAPIGPHGHLL